MKNDEEIMAHLLGMCERVQREFTLREIVSRALDDKPELILALREGMGRTHSQRAHPDPQTRPSLHLRGRPKRPVSESPPLHPVDVRHAFQSIQLDLSRRELFQVFLLLAVPLLILFVKLTVCIQQTQEELDTPMGMLEIALLSFLWP